ncbi:MAG: hypothetical protein UHM08_09250 [Bacteroidales bacterium]|nr:hypothetical protein [Bacteroidales bacterium]
MKTFYQMTEEEKTEYKVTHDAKVESLHEQLLNEIGSRYNFFIRECSNSRTTNLKRLNNWKLIEVSNMNIDGWGLKCFHITVESVKGIKKHLYDWEKMIKIG